MVFFLGTVLTWQVIRERIITTLYIPRSDHTILPDSVLPEVALETSIIALSCLVSYQLLQDRSWRDVTKSMFTGVIMVLIVWNARSPMAPVAPRGSNITEQLHFLERVQTTQLDKCSHQHVKTIEPEERHALEAHEFFEKRNGETCAVFDLSRIPVDRHQDVFNFWKWALEVALVTGNDRALHLATQLVFACWILTSMRHPWNSKLLFIIVFLTLAIALMGLLFIPTLLCDPSLAEQRLGIFVPFPATCFQHSFYLLDRSFSLSLDKRYPQFQNAIVIPHFRAADAKTYMFEPLFQWSTRLANFHSIRNFVLFLLLGGHVAFYLGNTIQYVYRSLRMECSMCRWRKTHAD